MNRAQHLSTVLSLPLAILVALLATNLAVRAQAPSSQTDVSVGDGWRGIDPAQLPAELTRQRDFQLWWSWFYPRTYPTGVIPRGADLAAWREIQVNIIPPLQHRARDRCQFGPQFH